jgi:Cdc6-like AAA superfamily ATPase
MSVSRQSGRESAAICDRLLQREWELHAIAQDIDAASSNHGSVVYIEGPAGIGKTALLDAATQLAAAAHRPWPPERWPAATGCCRRRELP